MTISALVFTVAGAYGVWLVYTAVALHWTGLAPGPDVGGPRRRPPSLRDWLVQAGLADVEPREFAGVVGALFLLSALGGYALFGGLLPALACGAFAATFPPASYRARRDRRLAVAREAWPRMIEELRVLTGSVGRSIPQALFEVGRRGPADLRPAFAAAEREWLLSTDFTRTVDVLRMQLADPTADAVCETLLIAYELGGTDLDQRLAGLAEDRAVDVNGRKEAEAKQAGVVFARRFVLVVPLGMALAGSAIGTGRAAYATPLGQVLVVIGLTLVAGCWVWAGRLLRLPQEERVFLISSAGEGRP
jgi:tight adherence protein B